jgi:two-component sensor histidine kinase
MPSGASEPPVRTITAQGRRWNLHAVDLLLVASLLVPLAIFGGVAAFDRGRTLASVERDLITTLDTLHGHAENIFRLQALALGAAKEHLRGIPDAELRNTASRHQQHLAALRRHADGVIGIVAFDSEGRPLLDAEREVVPEGVTIADRPYFRHHRDDPSALPIVSGPFRSRASGTTVFFTTARRDTPDGRFAGVIAVGTRHEEMTRHWSGAARDPDALVALIREDGAILARQPPLDPELNPALPPAAPLAALIRSGQERVVVRGTSPIDGVDRIFAIRRLERVPVYVAHGLPLVTALGDWRRRMQVYGSFAVAAAASLFLLALLARRRTGDLHQLNATLEARVAERTAELQAGEASLRLLAREVDHRAKNALAVVQATLRLTPKLDTESYARAVEGRVSALARAQTLLAQNRWRGASLRALLDAELARPGGEGASRVTLEGPPVLLPPEAAQPLAMAVHELATNATSHGALSVPGGRVCITWRLEGPGPDQVQQVVLRWVEVGGPVLDAPPARRGFGSRVLDGVLRGQLGGTLSLDWRPSGLVCELCFPLSRLSRAEGHTEAA